MKNQIKDEMKNQDEDIEMLIKNLDQLKNVTGDINDTIVKHKNILNSMENDIINNENNLNFLNKNTSKIINKFGGKSTICIYFILVIIIIILILILILIYV
jgi:t-SNARE complex subunit (syntaxin)